MKPAELHRKCVGIGSWHDDHELVAAQSRDVIGIATSLTKALRDEAQNLVALDVSETVIHLFESV